jgi:hypothetical protein
MKFRLTVAVTVLLLAVATPALSQSTTTVPSSGAYTGQNQNLPQNLPPPVINNDPLPNLPTTTKPVVTTKAPAPTTTIAPVPTATGPHLTPVRRRVIPVTSRSLRSLTDSSASGENS